MFLLSPEILELCKICVNLGTFFRVIPYQWDGNKNSLVLTPKKRRIHERVFSWDSIKYLSFVHLIFISSRLWQSISSRRHFLPFYIMQSVYTLIFALGSLIQFLIIQNRTEMLVFFNRFLQFAQSIERK